MKKIFSDILKGALDIVFPRSCAFCGKISDDNSPVGGVCASCFADIDLFEKDGVLSFSYEGRGVENVVYGLKYDGYKNYAGVMAETLFIKREEYAVRRGRGEDELYGADYFTSVPVHANRFKERGFNQAELLARAAARLYGVQYAEFLVRARDTLPQFGLSEKERKINVKGAFKTADNMCKILENKTIALFDDVFTTGATMRECERELLNAGAKKTLPAAFASTPKRAS